jgi:hypothetical protein
MNNDGNYNEKKLLGSGGYVFAKLADEEQNKSNLGVSEIFLGQAGRLKEDRFLRYYCNKCQREYQRFPKIDYENPNEELGDDVILVEREEYKCNTLAQYRKFNK